MAKRHRQPDPIDITSPAATSLPTAKAVPPLARRRTDELDATRHGQSEESSDDISLSDHDELHVGDSTETDTTSMSANDAAVFDSDSDTAELEEDEMTGDDGNQDEDTDSVDLDDSSDDNGRDDDDEEEIDERDDDDTGSDGGKAGERMGRRKRARQARHAATKSSDDDDDADESSDDSGPNEGNSSSGNNNNNNKRGVVTVDFGVYDFKASQVDAVLHLIDQFCPDHQNEVDRDAFGTMLAANPFTCVVRVNDEDEDDVDRDAAPDAEIEIYGLASVLDLAHGVQSQAAALRPLYELLQRGVWRTAAPGLSPLELLMSTVEESGTSATTPAKCVLLLAEYIRNVPLELTVCILEDLVTRLGRAEDDATAMVRVTHPCMYAILAKVQRAVEPPVTLQPTATTTSHRKKAVAGKRGGAGQGDGDGGRDKDDEHGAKAMLDMSRYIFWQEEKSVLYDFRDKRVATLVYRCRAQYDGQSAQEVPLSVLFVVQHGAMLQAIDEMKKRATAPADVTRY